MALSYEFLLNSETLDATIGAMVYDKLEEALDEAAFHLPITTFGFPKKILGLLEIKISDGQSQKNFNLLIISDEVSDTSKDGFYEHNLTAIEYTHKLDKYFVSALTFTQPFIRNARAPFEFFIEGGPSVPTAGLKEIVPRVFVNETYRFGDTIDIPITNQSIVAIPGGSELRDTYVKTNLSGFPNDYNISTNAFSLTIPENEGFFYLDVGYIHQSVFVKKFRHYFRVVRNIGYSLYDMINRVRAMIPIERESIFERTRIFEIEPSLVDLFKSIEMPQMFFKEQTARQVLNTIFKYINAISRLKFEKTDNDLLSVDFFNKIQGQFDSNDITTFQMNQNAQDYGTRAISFLSQTLQSNFRDNPSVVTPANNLFKIIRSKNIQLTDSNFELKLEKPIYELYKVEVMLPKVKFRAETSNGLVEVIKNNFILDITPRFLEKTIWDLKSKTLDIFSYPVPNVFAFNVGLRENQGGNIPWLKNSNSIDLSILFGDFIKNTLLVQVVQEALNEEMTLRLLEEDILNNGIDGSDLTIQVINADYRYFLDKEENAYRNISFNVEYSTLDDTVIRQERLDTEFVNYNSDVRINNFQSVSDYGRVSRDLYGKIERSGVPSKTITKIHTSLSDVLDVGKIDANNYIITERKLIFHNEFLEGVYTLTRNHNRLNEFNGIDQEYRAVEIPSFNETVKRLDFYSDYIYIVKPGFSDKNPLSETDTTIYDFEFKFEEIFNHLNGESYIPKGAIGNNTKITFAFVRTDGFLKEFPDNQGKFNAIMTPVVSFGGKNNLNFNFKFDNNQIAGDAITPASLDGIIGNIGNITNYYNKPIRYTDDQGFFDKLWFGMASSFSSIMFIDENVRFPDIAQNEPYFNQLYAYPLVRGTQTTLQQNFLIKNQDFTNPDWFIIFKDAATNYGFSYQLNIIPLDFNDYIIGQNFYTENPLVMNQDVVVQKILYIYDDGTTYNMFDDLQIKGGYSSSINITTSNLVSYLEDFNYLFEGNALTALNGSTSWAIGDEDGNLFLACNKPYTGFKLLARHNRLNTLDIGLKFIVLSGTSSHIIDSDITFDGYITLLRLGESNYNIDSELVFQGYIFLEIDGTSNYNIDSNLTFQGYVFEELDGTSVYNIDSSLLFQGYIFLELEGLSQYNIDSNLTFDAYIFLELDGTSQHNIDSNLTFNGYIYLELDSTSQYNIDSSLIFDGDIFIESSGTSTYNIDSGLLFQGDILLEQEGTSTDNIDSNLTFDGEIEIPIVTYQLKGYATTTPVNITVDFDDESAFTFTMQTFEQIIGTKEDGTSVTVTAPASYVLNGVTYTFVDWRVDETNQTSTNRIFTTTIDQQKTLRLRYIGFGEF